MLAYLSESPVFSSAFRVTNLSVALSYFAVAESQANRSPCKRRKVGAVAVRDDRILATGRNGNIPKAPHCDACMREQHNIPSGKDLGVCRAIHAEMNLFVQAASMGISLSGSSIFITHKPCYMCFKLLMSLNPKAIFYKEDYPDPYVDIEMALTHNVVGAIIHPDESFYCYVIYKQSRLRNEDTLLDWFKGIGNDK